MNQINIELGAVSLKTLSALGEKVDALCSAVYLLQQTMAATTPHQIREVPQVGTPEERAAIFFGTETPQEAQDAPKAQSEESVNPAEEVSPEPVAEPTAPAPEVKPIEDSELQKAVTLRVSESPAVKKKVRELVNTYADKVTSIPQEKRAEFLDALAKL